MGYHQPTNKGRNVRWVEFDEVTARDADGGLEQALGPINIELGQTNINPQELRTGATVKQDPLVKDNPRAPTKSSRCVHTYHPLRRDDRRTALGPRLLLPVALCRLPLVLANGLPLISIHLPTL
jgi:hypothetical protein